MKKVLLLMLSALLITAAFLTYTASIPIFFFLVPAALVSLEEKKWKRRLLMGVLWGALIFLFNFYWTVVPIHYYGRMSYPLSVLLFFPLMLYQMLPFTLWFVFFPPLFRKNFFLPVLLLPFLTSVTPLIFPYSISSTLSRMPALAQTASWWGEWGLDGLIVLVNLLLLMAWKERQRRYGALAIGIVLLMLTQGLIVENLPSGPSGTPASSVSVVVVQPCVRDGDREALKEKKFFTAIGSIRGISAGKWVVIPESALPDGIVERPDFMEVMGEIRRSLGASSLLFNGVIFRDGLLTNTEFLLGKDGKIARYDKQHLMWFGEQFPFYSLFRRLPIYAAGFANFSAGPNRKALKTGKITVATPICLEGIYQGYVAKLAKSADLIVNPTDDEWFGSTRATRLHFAQVRLKAIENRRWLIRATNTGYTVVVNQWGQKVKDLPPDKPGHLVVNVPLLHQPTVFQRIHSVIPWVAFLLFCGIFLVSGGKEED